jgi:hypothetical protein
MPVQCLLDCVERLMVYFNRYALTYASIYGTPFIESGGSVSSRYLTCLSPLPRIDPVPCSA